MPAARARKLLAAHVTLLLSTALILTWGACISGCGGVLRWPEAEVTRRVPLALGHSCAGTPLHRPTPAVRRPFPLARDSLFFPPTLSSPTHCCALNTLSPLFPHILSAPREGGSCPVLEARFLYLGQHLVFSSSLETYSFKPSTSASLFFNRVLDSFVDRDRGRRPKPRHAQKSVDSPGNLRLVGTRR